MVIGIQTAGLFLMIIWLIILSIFIWKIYSRFSSIFKDSKDQKMTSILDKLVREYNLAKKDITSLQVRITTLEDNTLTNIQKIGLMRFNPFHDTGGEQSFILALLDAHNSGVIISGLYARSGMRWYIKKVMEGKGIEHELSEEEKKAIETAK